MLKKRFWNNYVRGLFILVFLSGYVTLSGTNAVAAQTVLFYANASERAKCENALGYMYEEDDIPVISEDSDIISMDTYEDNRYRLGRYGNSVIKNLNSTSVVTISSSNPDVVDVGYCEWGTSDTDIDDYFGSILINGNDINGYEIPVIEFRAKSADNKKHKAKADITITIADTEGKHEPIVRMFQINVKGVKPKLSAKYTKTNFDIDSIYLDLSKITRNSKITISANKDKAFVVEWGGKNGKGVTVGKKAKRIWRSDDGICLKPKKLGKLTVKVTVKQDGYTVTKSYKLNVVKYVNPFKSVKIYDKRGKSQEIAKYYDKGTYTTGYMYGHTGKCTVILKSDYSMTKVNYYDYGAGKEKTCKLKRSNGGYTFEVDGRCSCYYVICKDKSGNIYEMKLGRGC